MLNSVELEKIHKQAFEALRQLDEILTRNNVSYFLLAGSTLGAVRHKGFIPWDDDIDVGIFVEDKEKAYRLLESGLKGGYSWADISCVEKWPRLFGKILFNGHSCVDVFLIVKASNNKLKRKMQWAARKILFKLYKSKIDYANDYEKANFKSLVKVYISKCISVIVPLKLINYLIERNEVRYADANNFKYYLNLYSAYSLEKELIKKEWLDSFSYVSFEGQLFPTVNDTDGYLTHLYGDYMKLPDEKERVLRHEERF